MVRTIEENIEFVKSNGTGEGWRECINDMAEHSGIGLEKTWNYYPAGDLYGMFALVERARMYWLAQLEGD